ncbi:DUF4011 domain-containing protein [Candidatus Methylobacter oryzae]|uniref:DUF4011 domain-containing protein n=1 Tax=Candidatus Methylobacter oryzae TaxID=2497749 RepID=A0ABY3C5J2_9GAMM|nr:DUF4011 domain-containing protein [Candidatus Methylobacter oryzae]TRW89747.1 DUF4011 domain-containing protein [Candidatus Methylobacter oryzae]
MPNHTEEMNKQRLTVEINVAPTVSYASYQNHVPLLRSLTLVNDGEDSNSHDYRNIEVIVRTEPSFADVVRFRFELLGAGETRKISPLDLKFNHTYLAELTEREYGRLIVQVLSEDSEIFQSDQPVEILAYDQWAGTRSLPELLAAFSLPNNPVVDRLIHSAGELLTKAGKGPSMNGYQSKNREACWAQVSAIYNSIGALNIHYISPPASFGTDGQKIRTPDRILSGGVATCLDIAMLLASCMEQAGLNPIILLKNGHAWVGCWLINTSFPTPVFDDAQAIRKRITSGELIAFETTILTHRPTGSLRGACEIGLNHLQDESEFLFAIDVRRARIEQVLPLPSRGQLPVDTSPEPISGEPEIEPPPALPSLDGETVLLDEDIIPESPEGRLARWKAKLLDLTLRNRLINFKPTKVALPLRVADPCQLEDALSDGQEWKFHALPQIMQGSDPRVSELARQRTGEDPLRAAAIQAMREMELLADVDPKTLDGRLYEIYSATRLGLEEGGANTLYLALGFLRWAEDERSEKTHMAPILLIPVTLTRQSVRSGYAIKRHDDEAIVNPTLMELLRQNFQLSLKGLEPLPTDNSGVDVAAIWQIFRLAVKEIPRWEVLEDQVYLGIFSFTKYLMWKDLQDRSEQLKRNKVVNHLIERPRESMGTGDSLLERHDMDERHPPESLLTPMLADSSQLNAISRACSGFDFALEGPPGTGKSQTITNLIAHFLGTGRTVLFVSEKMAALDVVHRRLVSIGLGPFCLQLHSAKARKTEVLEQLRASLDVSNRFTEEGWKREAQRLSGLRANLNDFVRVLHKEHRNGLTVQSAIGTAIEFKHWNAAPMPWSDPEIHSIDELEQLRELSRSMQAVAGELDSVRDNPLSAISYSDWTNAWADKLFQHCQQLQKRTVALQNGAVPIEQIFGLNLGAASADLYRSIDRLAGVLLQVPQVPAGLARRGNDNTALTQLQLIRRHGEQRQLHWDKLSSLFNPGIAKADGERLAEDWQSALLAWWPKRWFAKRSVRSRLRFYSLNRKRPKETNVAFILEALRRLNKEDKALEKLEPIATELLDVEYKAHETNWEDVRKHESWCDSANQALVSFSGMLDAAKYEGVRERFCKLGGEQRGLLGSASLLAAQLSAFRDAWRDFQQQLESVIELADSNEQLAGGDSRAAGLTSRILATLFDWSSHRHRLQGWCRWRSLRNQAIASGLAGVIEALESGDIEAADLEDFSEYSYRNWWLKGVIDREPLLRNFSSADHERKIKEFQQLDERFQNLTEQYITAVLAGKIPRNQDGRKPDAEMALLLRELAKQKAHLPVRKLVQGVPTLLPKLKPCLLMSPLSVAQYLDASHANFDIVVFDEASQIPTWDAVGAIARGRQLIVVGDPKQLPPTNFFGRSDHDSEIDGDSENQPVKDLESILDECLGAGMPTLRLEWHYRSRHESLINFSNHRYYDSRLITFPSPVTDDVAVKLEVVQGIYDRGATRTNRTEAEAIVGAIVSHFSDDALCRFTLGVVTFNQTQQRLIEKLLDEELRKAPLLESRIQEHGSERLFIKNLENVQGDERDFIMFSVTYGKDAAGRMPMNFGPLNQEGGERRLNVAITRARMGVTIYSSIRPDEIDLSRSRSAGVTDLKHYLEFAERGPRALAEQSVSTGREPDSPFEVEVIRSLRNKGWIVHPQVGCSGYRIDMAVVDPKNSGKYILGIECDGATYHSLPTARDRDRLREMVLNGLGWKLHRIWSSDWWTDPQREIEKLEAALNGCVANQAEIG